MIERNIMKTTPLNQNTYKYGSFKWQILCIYLLIQPIIDVLSTLSRINTELATSPGTLVRGGFIFVSVIFIVFLKSKSSALKIITILLSILIAISVIFWSHEVDFIFANLSSSIQTYYAIYFYIISYSIYSDGRYRFTSKNFSVLLVLYMAFIIIPIVLGISLNTYTVTGLKGYKGLFYAGNEISSIISILSPIFIQYTISKLSKRHFILILPLVLVLIYITFSLGTRVPVLALCTFLATLFVYYCTLAVCLHYRNSVYLKNSLKYLTRTVVYIFVCIVVFATNPAYRQNQDNYHGNAFQLVIEEENEYEPVTSNIMISSNQFTDSNMKSLGSITPTRTIELVNEFREEDYLNFINMDIYKRLDRLMNNRLSQAQPAIEAYVEGGTMTHFFGIGYLYYGSRGLSNKEIETEFLGFLLNNGIIGLLVWLSSIMFVVAKVINVWRKYRVKRNSVNMPEFAYIYSFVLGLALAAFSGHTLTAPSVSTLLVMIALVLTKNYSIEKAYEKNNILKEDAL